ncbi:hypothetical protein [Candidatus Arsenophonus triatominarum]|uniref:hypothetical protein n=1 Tax=Candidatus Arsenophonus triatominarum TaxID=57911 RepID=UPI0007C53DFA|nr:hypothetical protein [Candidatus Arsenophonus triatominarum]
MDIIKIKNIEKICKVIDNIKNGELIDANRINLSELSNVCIKAYGEGKQFEGVLTSSICYGLRDFHNELLKTYCIIKYGTDNLKSLKNSEKDALEITFVIEHGSTKILAKWENIINAFNRMTEGMSGNVKAICYIVTVLAFTGYFCFDKNTDKELQLEKTKEQLSASIETQRILKEGMIEALRINNINPQILDEVEAKASQAYEKVLKPFSDANKVEISSTINNSVLDNKELNEFIANPTTKLQTIDSTKVLLIEGIKRSPEKLTVTCSEIDSNHSFTMYINTGFISQTEIDILFDAFKKDKHVAVQGSYKTRAGVIEEGVHNSVSGDFIF